MKRLIIAATLAGLQIVEEGKRTTIKRGSVSVILWEDGSMTRGDVDLSLVNKMSFAEVYGLLKLKRPVSNTRNLAGVKDSADGYRKGGERVCFSDGYNDEVTLRMVAEIRAQGFRAWRTKDTIWVLAEDVNKINVTPD